MNQGKGQKSFAKEHTGSNTLFQHKRRLYTWTSPDESTQKIRLIIFFEAKMEKLYTVNKNKTRS